MRLTQLAKRGLEAFERKEYAEALKLFRSVLAERPGFADIRHHAGLCLGFLGETEAAIAEIDQALAENPAYVEAHVSRALLLQEVGRYDEARDAFQSACHHERESHGRFPAAVTARLANAHAELGDLYLAAGNAQEAASQFLAALELRPQFHDIRNKRAAALLALGRTGEAISELRAVLEGNPRFLSARLNLGLACYREGRLEEAAAEWRACAAQQAEHPQVRAYLALLDRNRSDEAGH
jgi:tetratricopeptide (TPR) repeat protein